MTSLYKANHKVHKSKAPKVRTVAQLSHDVQLKRIQIENYKRCYTNIESQTLPKRLAYKHHLSRLEAELHDLEMTLANHPNINTEV